eukprot:EG_transcript_14751
MALRGPEAVRRSFLQSASIPACSRGLWMTSKKTLCSSTFKDPSFRDDKVQTLYTNSDEAGYAMGLECKISAILKDELNVDTLSLMPSNTPNSILFLSKNPVASVLDRFLQGSCYPKMKRRQIQSVFQSAYYRMVELIECLQPGCVSEQDLAALFSPECSPAPPAPLFIPIPSSPCALA